MTTSSTTRSTGRILDYLLSTTMLACFAIAGWNFVGNPVSEAATSQHDKIAEPSPRDVIQTSTKQNDSPQYVTRNIEDLQPGDLVLAREEHGRSIEYKPIKEIYRRTSYHIRRLTFETKDGTQQTLQTTDEHPFWSVTDRAWVDAGDLKPGSKVTSPTGTTQTRTKTSRTEHPEGIPVFNFQVDDFHTYFVADRSAATPLLVHNADYLDPNTIHLSHKAAVSKTFSNSSHGTVGDLAEALRKDPSIAHNIPPIEIAKVKGKIYSANNRRLRAFQLANVDIPTIPASKDAINKIKRRIDSLK